MNETKELVRFEADNYAEVLRLEKGDILALYGHVTPEGVRHIRDRIEESHPGCYVLYVGASVETEVIRERKFSVEEISEVLNSFWDNLSQHEKEPIAHFITAVMDRIKERT